MKDNDKITLTFGQIKKLIKESMIDDKVYEEIRMAQNDKKYYAIGYFYDKEPSSNFIMSSKDFDEVDEIALDSLDNFDFVSVYDFTGKLQSSYYDNNRKHFENCRKKQTGKFLKEYEIDDNGYDDEGNYGGPWAKYDWERRHGRIWSDPDEETPYSRRRKHGKWWPNARGDMPGYGDPETWGGREPH